MIWKPVRLDANGNTIFLLAPTWSKTLEKPPLKSRTCPRITVIRIDLTILEYAKRFTVLGSGKSALLIRRGVCRLLEPSPGELTRSQHSKYHQHDTGAKKINRRSGRPKPSLPTATLRASPFARGYITSVRDSIKFTILQKKMFR